MSLLIRERPPLRLEAGIATPGGAIYRWASDEWKPENVPNGLTFSTAMPGGFDQASLTLPRKPSLDYADLEELSTVTVRGVGGRVAWQGRLETAPRTSGDQLAITPGLVGWQSHLDDDNSAREIYVDVSLNSWQGVAIQRQINLLNTNVDETDGSMSTDATGEPAFTTALTGALSREGISEGWYDAKGLPIGRFCAGWKLQATSTIGDAASSAFYFSIVTSDDDVATGGAFDSPGNLTGAGPTGTASLTPTATTRKWAGVQLAFGGAGLTDGVNYPVFWTCLAIYGRHGLPLIGTLTSTSAFGLLSSDIEAHAIGKWAPALAFTTGAGGSIQPSSYVIPSAVFTDPTTAGAIIKAVVQYELRDWAVWDGPTGPTYYSNARGARGNLWRARVGPAGLQETGASISRLFNGAIVTYTDVTGISRSVGPPGSGCDTEDSSLLDPDPSNPANEAGIRKWSPPIQLGTSTPAGAIDVGALFLQEQKLLDTSGQAAIDGHVQDANGVWHPAWAIRAGDQISFVDSSDTSYRRIVSTSWDDGSKTNQINLDAPPDGEQALLERLSAALIPLGFS